MNCNLQAVVATQRHSQSWIKVQCTLDVHHILMLHLNNFVSSQCYKFVSLESGIHALCIPVISCEVCMPYVYQ